MNLLEILLLFCGFFTVLIVSGVSSQDLSIVVDPPKPSLSQSIFINCTTDVMSKKIQSFSIYRGKEEILTFDPTSRPRVQWSDESLKDHFTFFKDLKKQTTLSLQVKNPVCTDGNIYKCLLSAKNKDPKEAQERVDFYVPKNGVELTQNKATNCFNVDITCIGHAGNPPETMGWFKKTPDHNEFESIDASYITTNMDFSTEDCSNTRKERLVYKPTEDERDLIIKCGFGDMTKEVTMRMPGQRPQDVTLMYKGKPEVGGELELNCTGKITEIHNYTIIFYKRTEMNTQITKIMAAVKDEKSVQLDDCTTMVTKLVTYSPTQEDKGLELMCRITGADRLSSDAMQVIDVQGLFVVPTGITPDHVPDGDGDDMDKDNEMDHDDKNTDDNMPDESTVVPEPEPEGSDEDLEPKTEGEPKENKGAKEKPKTDTSVSENSSGMLREYCLLIFATALLVMV
ncbi:Hypothetical predicted protein [Octopus vulgaris]|uniref:Ig-like domain-containing protein n=1 Tax=Octopus vulgaris TaxID=6645 RepID=A0AA36FG22_OCTVU|nr:Hypothetical predicted protein [Octopus vulgaris]